MVRLGAGIARVGSRVRLGAGIARRVEGQGLRAGARGWLLVEASVSEDAGRSENVREVGMMGAVGIGAPRRRGFRSFEYGPLPTIGPVGAGETLLPY